MKFYIFLTDACQYIVLNIYSKKIFPPVSVDMDLNSSFSKKSTYHKFEIVVRIEIVF